MENILNKIELSIIIVNYNGLKYLKDCFDSIYTYCNDISFEIIVVDNNSSDESCDFIKKEYPKIILIESKENLGFAGGNNLGVKKAVGKYLLLLNNDTILLNTISPAITSLKEDESVGVVGVKMLNKNKEYLPSVGKFPSPLKLLKFSFLDEKRKEFLKGDFSKKQYFVDWVTGAFIVVSKELYQKVNGLDEDYFMYVEDVDFCKKIKNLGKKILFIPQVSYIHFVGFNSNREPKLINGYKIYANKHFNFVNTILAKLSLQINYVYKKAFKNIS